jgi:hypothetical protein
MTAVAIDFFSSIGHMTLRNSDHGDKLPTLLSKFSVEASDVVFPEALIY